MPARLALIRAVQAYAAQYGKKAEPVLREGLAVRLEHERRLGELLAGTVKPGKRSADILVRDENKNLPPGVSEDLSSHAQTLKDTPADWFKGVTKGVRAGTRRRAVKEIYLEAKRIAAGDGKVIPHDQRLLLGDFREVGASVPDDSVSLIFTDPPYDRASLPLYGALAEFVARVLLPGGSLLTYAPTYALPEVFEHMKGPLRYWWTLIVLHSGNRALMQEYGLRVGYKPLLWYTKGGRHNKQAILSDVLESSEEKTEHEWQQSLQEARAAIEALTSPGDLVVDPMAGSGTTLAAAASLGRKWLGIEIDADTLALANQRLQESR